MAVFGCHTRRLPAQLLTVPLFATCLIASATVSCYVGIWNTGPSIARPHRVHTLTAACFSRAGAGGHLDRHSAVTVVRRRRGAVGTAVLTSVQRTACARTRVNCEAHQSLGGYEVLSPVCCEAVYGGSVGLNRQSHFIVSLFCTTR